MAIARDMTELVGNTPMVYLNRLASGLPGRVAVKLETFNPASSVKDRIGLAMIEAAEKAGSIKPGSVLVEATSGNTGIALAYVGAVKGYRVILTMPDTMSQERRRLLTAFGAELHLTPGAEGMRGSVAAAEQIVAQTPGAVMARQFDNPANPAVHRATTAEEIWSDTDGTVDVFVAGVGTGGTVSGVGGGLKEHNSRIRVVALEPSESPVISGGKPGPHRIQGIGAGFVPKNFDRSIVDEVLTVTADEATTVTRRLGKEEGILCGVSAGANVVGALRLAGLEENRDKLIVTVICDTGERYLSTWLFDESAPT